MIPDETPPEDIRILIDQIDKYKKGESSIYPDEEEFDMVSDFYMQVIKNVQALEVVEIGLTLYPFSTLLMLSKANLLIVLSRFEETLDILDAVELYSPNDIDVYILRLEASLALGMQEKAEELYETAKQMVTGEELTEMLFEFADVFDDYHLPERSFYCIKQILEEEPANEEALFKICFFTDTTGLFAESIELHNNIIEEQPYNELAWFNLGTAYQGLGLHEKAIDAYHYALAINDKFDIAYRNLADALIRIRGYEDAIEALENALSFAANDAVLYNALGFCYVKLLNFHKARENYRKSVELSKDYDIQVKIGKTYMAQHAWKFAIREMNLAIQINPRKTDAYAALGTCHRMLKEFEEATKNFMLALKGKPKHQGIWLEYLQTLYEAGKFESGILLSNEAFDKTGGKPVFAYYMAMFLFALNKPGIALNILQEALLASPKQASQITKIDERILQNKEVVKLLSQYKQPQQKQPRKK